ncbi:4Fe-4S binding protein [Cronobacter sakazakii]|uniref:4Fe-4S binding protein n=1 Tax=Cronobacter sakazakii TaxID=28141 RepID=UPI002895B6EE|nr:4Fe-4S binding protein [Cronobacter sakazakii]EIZ9235348.1 4Fe-4S binding protein [Cronobacter sakazakii]ELY4181822.1 4Fe-4S binding protein [Cronobacter sakazakii]MDT3650918.1 4Fe-4S binding protein [Cronobacter sakazakii]
MDLFDTFAPAQPCVGARCARKRLARSRCDYCVTRCPSGALAIHHHEVILTSERCTGCGICLFVCPADALEDLVPLARIHREGVLLGPFTQPVAAEELMLWHTLYRIRAVAVDLTRYPLWLRPLAELNLWLKKRGEPGWQCVAVSPAAGEAKRRLLRPDSERARVAHDVATRHAAGAFLCAYAVMLDTTRCLLCGACGRACASGAIRFGEQDFTLNTGRCDGCGDCAAVCPVDAITITEGDAGPLIRRALHHARCELCGEPWRAWHPGEKVCPVCQRHGFSMRSG